MHNSYAEVKNKLADARDRGDIKDSTCANACKWLAPSFAGVEINGITVGAHIEKLVAGQQWSALDDGYFKMNSFGTAGVRGRLAIGTAHFNKIILGLGVEAHARYICREYEKNGRDLNREKAVVLAYDSRKGSYDPENDGPGYLVQEAASIYAAHGITVYLFDSVAPTPELSFAIAELDDIRPYAGGVFTASHNPASDNGFKPYDFYGGQIVHKGVQSIADSITDYGEVKTGSYAEGLRNGLIRIVGADIDAAYIEKENQTAIWTDNQGHFRSDTIADTVKVVFSALNGTSQRLVSRVLERRGFDVSANFFPVEEQCRPDGDFPTCPKPNPEEKEALSEAVKLANTVAADILVATDPDSDRLGVGIRLADRDRAVFENDATVKDGYYLLSGNQQLVLLTDYILGQLIARDGKLPANSVVSKTLVSTDLARLVADAYGVMTIEPHVGFKFLGEKLDLYAREACARAQQAEAGIDREYQGLSRNERIRLLESYGLCCLFGGEESYGSLVGDYVKDKDAVTVGAMFVEMVGFYKKQNKTLVQRLEEIWQQYGYCREETISLTFEGASGNDVIRAIMQHFRKTPPAEFAGTGVIAAIDYQTPEKGGCRVAVDPSGCVLFDDAEPGNADEHTGYVDIEGVRVPHFWHGDYGLIGGKAKLGDSNVLMYVLDGGSKIIVRPSGTEPKIKFYVLAKGTGGSDKDFDEDRREVDAFFARAKQELTSRAATLAESITG